MATLAAVNEQLQKNMIDQRDNTMLLSEGLTRVNKTMSTLVDFIKQQQLDMLEALRERGDKAPEEKITVDDVKKPNMSKLAAILAGVAAVGLGIARGILDSIKALAKFFRLDRLLKGVNTRFVKFVDDAIGFMADALKPIRTFFSAEGRMGKFIVGLADSLDTKLFAPMRNAVRNFTVGFTRIGTKATGIVDDALKLDDFKSFPAKMGAAIGNIVKTILAPFNFVLEPIKGDFAKGIKAVFGGGDDVSMLSKLFNIIKAPFTAVMAGINKTMDFVKGAFAIFDEGSKFMTVLGNIGRVIGRLFLPFTVIMTAYDTIKGAIKGFEKDGFLGGLTGAVKGFLNSILGAPLDLLKDAVAWVLGKFGFDDTAEILKKFSFTKLISNTIDKVTFFFKNIPGIFSFLFDSLAFKLKNMLSFTIPGVTIPGITVNKPDLLGGGELFSTPDIPLWSDLNFGFDKTKIGTKPKFSDYVSTGEKGKLEADLSAFGGSGGTVTQINNVDNSSKPTNIAGYTLPTATTQDTIDPYSVKRRPDILNMGLGL